MSDYRLLLDRSGEALVSRSRGFRNLVIAVVAILFCALVGSLASLSPRPLIGLLLLIPTYAVFLWHDHRTLAGWRGALAGAWQRRDLDFSAFRQALSANKVLPSATVQGMLATLPVTDTLAAERTLTGGTRAAIATALVLRDAGQSAALACRAAGLTGLTLGLVLAVLLRTAVPLSACGLVLPLALFCAWSRRRRFVRALGRIRGLQGAQDCNLGQYREVMSTLAWAQDAAREQERLRDLGQC